MGNMQSLEVIVRKHAVLEVLEVYGKHTGSEEHAVLEVIVRNMQYWRSIVRKHAVLEVIVRNMQYWRS